MSAATAGNRSLLHSARSGDWLFNTDGIGETVILTEAGDKRAYPFRNSQTALKTLDALSMSYVAMATERRSAITAPISRTTGVLYTMGVL